MGAGLRVVKRRIKSVQSTRKITRAMELIAASRVQKAQQAMARSRPYADAITAALSELASNGGADLTNSYLQVRPNPKNAAVIVVTSDRGLAGAYSSNALKQAEELFGLLRSEGKESKVYVTGRKGTSYFKFRQRPVVNAWQGFSEFPVYDNAKVVADEAINAYIAGEVDEIFVCYTSYVSSLVQRATVKRLLPLEVVDTITESHEPKPAYEYEPDADAVLEQLLPRYIEVRLFSAFLESAASEQASRRRAMSTATDNATNLIGDLTREYNRARQAEITQELMEVVGAAEASSGSE